MFFLLDFNEPLPTDKIKECIKRIASFSDEIGAPSYITDPKLSEDIINLSISMFERKKKAVKSFTILKNKKLAKMKIDEDTGTFTEEDALFLNFFFQDNLATTFSQLVVYSYLNKPIKKHSENDLIFYASIYSRYSGENHDVFFVNNSNEYYIFDDRITNSKLINYVCNYFGNNKNTEYELAELAQNNSVNFMDSQRKITKIFKDFSEQKREDYNFINGTITFLDFLAWKGLWQAQECSKTLKEVSMLIEDFRKITNQYSSELFSDAKNIPLSRVINISDTIAIFTPQVSNVSEMELLELHAKIARYILETSIKGQYPIRGAISYGEYSFLNNIMIGPGIDECASWHERGDWIGVHLTPSAQFILNQNPNNKPNNEIILKYKIPIKSGTPPINFCIKWSIAESDFHKLTNKTKALLPEIAGKYLNTHVFLSKFAWKEGNDDGKE